MIFQQVVFYCFAATAIISALAILTTRNVLYAAFLLMITFLSIAAIYVFAAAEFIAIAQIMVYVGGILVLMVFGVMLTNRISGAAVTTGNHHRFWGLFIGISFFTLICTVIIKANFGQLPWIMSGRETYTAPVGTAINNIGIKLMTDFILPFEIAAIILLLALLGAAFVARKPQKN